MTVGEVRPLNGPVTLAEYDPAWPERFAALARYIRAALGQTALTVEHVGSTSVPGLAAKPIIDIVLAVADSSQEASYLPALEETGYALRIREPEWFEHRMLRGGEDDVNLHVFGAGCPEIDRMILFRDRLRTEPAERDLYESAKRELASRSWRHMQNYADAKSAVVAEILERAQAPASRELGQP